RPGSAGRAPSFATLDSATLEGDTIEQLDQVQGLVAQALRGGVATVNVCHPADLATELLTYAGAGTCYTLHDYCQVQRLGIDDYPQVAELIQRGVEEGYLKPRDPDAIARLIVNGYGARVGDHHVAGFVALLTEPYSPERLGELCALTTISRFAGEGIGEQLVQTMLQDAAATGLDGVFACTTAEPAARFFRRLGFVEVPQDQLPAAKWKDYDPVRRGDLRAFMHLLALI
ncbi:MAG: GNAT family N-acetyltransferase, partial [Euzebya sp.]